jgi:hypothetical protein
MALSQLTFEKLSGFLSASAKTENVTAVLGRWKMNLECGGHSEHL